MTTALLAVLIGCPALAEEPDRDPADLDTVVVTATRHASDPQDVPASVTVQDKRELDRTGFYAGGDEFRGVPGVFFRRGQGDNEDILTINFRGIVGNHGNDTFLALFDGLSFLSSDDELLMQELPYAAVDRVEIVRGPISALYGRGGLAGAVNYLSLSPDSDSSHISLRVGSDAYRRLKALYARPGEREGSGVVFSASHEKADGWRENNQRETSQLFAKGVLPLTDALDLTVYGSWMDRKYKTGGGIPTYADGTLFDLGLGREGYYGLPDSGQDLTSWFAAAKLSWDVNERLNWTTSLMQRKREFVTDQSFYDSWLFDPDDHLLGVNGFFSTGTDTISFLDSVVTWHGGGHTVTVGASHERGRPHINSGWSGQNGFTWECGFQWYAHLFDARTGEWVNRDHPCQSADVTAVTRGDTRFTAVFVQDEIALGERWLLTLGARYDSFERDVDMLPSDTVDHARREHDSDSNISPKASLAYRLDNGQLYAAYGQGYSSNFGPVWQWDAAAYDRDTRPSTLDSLELGYKATFFAKRLQLAAAVFAMEQKNRSFNIDNPASWDDPTLPGTLVLSGPPLKSRGAELSLAARLGDATRLSASASHVDAEWSTSDFYQRYPALPDIAGRTPVGVPGTMWNLNLDHRFSIWLSGRIGYEWYDDYFISLDNGRKGGGHALGNLSLSLTPPATPRFSAELVVSNLFDRDYSYFFGGATDVNFAVPGVPRQVWIDLRYDF
ncbi:MAG: TonB-dependent receptor [Luteimonas sp.]